MMEIVKNIRAQRFINKLNAEELKKAEHFFELLKENNGKLTSAHTEVYKQFKGLFCLRFQTSGCWFRFFYTVKNSTIILLSGFCKKSNAAPLNEVRAACALLKEYK